MEAGVIRFANRYIKTEGAKFSGDFSRIWSFCREGQKRTTSGRIGRRVWRTRRPFDEKGQKAGSVIGKAKRLPFEKSAVGPFAGAGSWSLECNLRRAEFFGEGLQVAGMRCPADQTRSFKRAELDSERIFRVGLRRIGRDDFKVAAFSEREQRVLRAAAWMYTPEDRTDAGALGDKVDA